MSPLVTRIILQTAPSIQWVDNKISHHKKKQIAPSTAWGTTPLSSPLTFFFLVRSLQGLQVFSLTTFCFKHLKDEDLLGLFSFTSKIVLWGDDVNTTDLTDLRLRIPAPFQCFGKGMICNNRCSTDNSSPLYTWDPIWDGPASWRSVGDGSGIRRDASGLRRSGWWYRRVIQVEDQTAGRWVWDGSPMHLEESSYIWMPYSIEHFLIDFHLIMSCSALLSVFSLHEQLDDILLSWKIKCRLINAVS